MQTGKYGLISGGTWNIYFLQPVCTGSVIHPEFYIMGTDTKFAGVNRKEREADRQHPCNSEGKCVRSCTATLLYVLIETQLTKHIEKMYLHPITTYNSTQQLSVLKIW